MATKTKSDLYQALKERIEHAELGSMVVVYDDPDNNVIVVREHALHNRGLHCEYQASTHWASVVTLRSGLRGGLEPTWGSGGLVEDASVLDIATVFTKVWSDVAKVAAPEAKLALDTDKPQLGIQSIDPKTLEELVIAQTSALVDLRDNYPHDEIASLKGRSGLDDLIIQSVTLLRGAGINDDDAWGCSITDDIPVAGHGPSPSMR